MKRRISRRAFVRGTSVAAAAAFLPRISLGRSQDVRPIRVGLVGCGGRGTGAAEDCLRAGVGVEIVALGDVFEDRIGSCLAHLVSLNHPGVQVKKERCFSGFDACTSVLDAGIDLVLLATPPGFRPAHFAAAVDAGKHVFMEKPVAVDPVGIRRVLAAGEKASAKGLSVVAGTQRRHEKRYRETIRRVHDGAIGEIVAARCSWNQGALWHRDHDPKWSDTEWQLRNWLYFSWLSGDHIVEQHVHNLDVINWALRAHPVAAVACGGRTVRTDPVYGNVYDHFGVDFEYPGGVHCASTSRQWQGSESDVSEGLVGTLGPCNPAGSIGGENGWKFEGDSPNPYAQEHADLLSAIRSGTPVNETRAVAESTLTAILGREAAYTGKRITWDEISTSTLDLSPGALALGPLPVAAVAVPGRTR